MRLATLLLLLLQSEEVQKGHFKVISTYRNSEYAQTIASKLDAGYPLLVDLLGVEPKETAAYPVRLYATKEEYVAIDKELNNGRFANNGGFTHRRTQETYIQIQPRLFVPLFERMETLVYHEAFHLITNRHAPWLDGAPIWLYEGMAEYAAEMCLKRESSMKTSHAINLVLSSHDRNALIPLADLLSADKSSDPDFLTRWLWYAESKLLVKYLAEGRAKSWKEFLGAMKTRGREDSVSDLLLKAVGGTRKTLENDWIAWLKGCKRAPWRILDGDWRLTKDGVEGAAYPKSSAMLVSAEPIRKARYALSAEVLMPREGAGQADLVFVSGKDLRGMNLWKASVVREGVAALVIRREGKWQRIAFAAIDPKNLPADRWLKLEVRMDDGAVSLRLDGERILEHTIKEEGVELAHVYWGLGNYDSWTQFRSIKLTPD